MSLQTRQGEHVGSEREKRFLAAHAACHDRIYRYFRRRTENASEAEDLCADVFRIVWEMSGKPGSLSVMVLFGVARNVLRNHDRSAARSDRLLGALQRERASEVPDQDSPLLGALERLRPDDREALLLTYWDGFNSREVSDLLDTTATAIRMRLHRARKELRDVLQAQIVTEGTRP
ncbi:MAG: RNA polymerase sigma factor [Actinomycetales bacterium]